MWHQNIKNLNTLADTINTLADTINTLADTINKELLKLTCWYMSNKLTI